MSEIKTDATNTFARITILLAPHLSMTIDKLDSRFQNPIIEALRLVNHFRLSRAKIVPAIHRNPDAIHTSNFSSK